MFYVGVLSVSEQANPSAVARELGVSEYDVRQWAGGLLPRIAFEGIDRSTAQARFESLAGHGYRAVILDASHLTTEAAPVLVRRLYLDADSIGTDGTMGLMLKIHAIDLIAHVAVKQRSERIVRSHPKVRSMTHTSYATEVEQIERSHTADNLLFLFSRGKEAPWLIRESSTRFLGLGPALCRASIENFRVTLALLKVRAGALVVDPRFATTPITEDTALTTRSAGFHTRVHALVEMLRMSWVTERGGAYRNLANRDE